MNYTMSSLTLTPGIVPCIGSSRAMPFAASGISLCIQNLQNDECAENLTMLLNLEHISLFIAGQQNLKIMHSSLEIACSCPFVVTLFNEWTLL